MRLRRRSSSTTPPPLASSTDPHARLSEGVGGLRVGGRSVDERTLSVLGGVLVPAGLLVILLGWFGASRTSNVFEQVPYLISGGLLGLALVFLGAFLYFAHWLTRLVQEQRSRSAAVVDAVNRLADAIDRRPSQTVTASSVVPAPTVPTGVADGADGNGGGDHTADVADLVVTGSGTLVHRRSCRVVVGKSGVRPAAVSENLAACRLCQPYD